MYGVLVRLGFLHAVFAAAVAAQQLDPFERKHVGMNIDDWHSQFLSLSAMMRLVEGQSIAAPDFSTILPQRTISDFT